MGFEGKTENQREKGGSNNKVRRRNSKDVVTNLSLKLVTIAN